jgi:hypothetical protein
MSVRVRGLIGFAVLAPVVAACTAILGTYEVDPNASVDGGGSSGTADVAVIDAGPDQIVDGGEDGPAVDAGPVGARLIGPLSGSITSTRTPLLRWEPIVTTGSFKLTVCKTRACEATNVVLSREFLSSVREFLLLDNANQPLPAGTYYWNLRSKAGAVEGAPTPTWTFASRPLHIAQAASPVHRVTLGNSGDLNGDGNTEIFAGTFYGDSRTPDGGGAPVLDFGGGMFATMGTPVGTAPAPLSWFTGAPTESFDVNDDQYAVIGDIDGDGYLDFARSRHCETGSGTPTECNPTVTLFRGGPSFGVQSLTTPLVTLQNPGAPDNLFGRTITAAGDMNGDGYADFAVSAMSEGLAAVPIAARGGAVYVYFGGPDVTKLAQPTSLFPPPGGQATGLGTSLAAVGDVDTDGFDDLVVLYRTRGPILGDGGIAPNSFEARLIMGSGKGADLGPSLQDAYVFSPGEPFAEPNALVSPQPGDFDGDGFPDIALGVPKNNDNHIIVVKGKRNLPPTDAMRVNGAHACGTSPSGAFGTRFTFGGTRADTGKDYLVVGRSAYACIGTGPDALVAFHAGQNTPAVSLSTLVSAPAAGQYGLRVGGRIQRAGDPLSCITIASICDLWLYCPQGATYTRQQIDLPGCVPDQSRSNISRAQ